MLDVLNVELGINARVIDFEGRVNQPTTDVSTSKMLPIPVPMVYYGIQVKPVEDISIEAEAQGIAYDSNSYLDIIGRVKVKIYGPAFIGTGYRYEAGKIDESDSQADVNFKGPFVELGLNF